MKKKKLAEEVEMIGQGVPPLTPEQAAEISAFFQKKLAASRKKREAAEKRRKKAKKPA